MIFTSSKCLLPCGEDCDKRVRSVKKDKRNIENSTATITALIPKIGYSKAGEIIQLAQVKQISIKNAAVLSGFISENEFDELVTPEAVCRLGN